VAGLAGEQPRLRPATAVYRRIGVTAFSPTRHRRPVALNPLLGKLRAASRATLTANAIGTKTCGVSTGSAVYSQNEIAITAKTVAELLREERITSVDVLQIDTEGHDWKILSQFARRPEKRCL
jgi:FkbM family methyltransferase